ALTEHILAKLNAGKIDQLTLSTAALAVLQQYHFPGNVRELENILERALALYDGNCIEIDDLNLPVSLPNDSDSPEYNPAMGPLEDYLEEIERKAITLALEENKWNKTAAAQQLGLAFRSFRYRLKKLDLNN
ncbi:MAG: sigma-54-dependent Fis family transcriptional regulator, partial [Methylococcaceae bacterium]|nr:sigma-54-dependent Fis family transcriptional regulator [Methylococcaceae bacterium]